MNALVLTGDGGSAGDLCADSVVAELSSAAGVASQGAAAAVGDGPTCDAFALTGRGLAGEHR